VLARRIAAAVLGAFVVVSVLVVVAQELRREEGGPGGPADGEPQGDVLVATYFHGNRRCATCNTIEAWAREAMHDAFPKEIRSGRIAWRTANYEEARNAAHRERYGLYSSAIVLSDVRGGEERRSVDLEEIWALSTSERGLKDYVVRETRAFLESVP